MRHLFLSLLGLIALIGSAAPIQSYRFHTPQGREVIVTAINDYVVKVSNIMPGQEIPEAHWGEITPSGTMNVSQGTSGNTILNIGDKKIQVIVDGTGSLSISSGLATNIYDSGVREMKDGLQRLELKTDGWLHFYGAGERGYSFNIAGDTMVMYNKQNYAYEKGEERIKQMGICMPLFIASTGYAVVFDDYAAAKMIMTDPVVYETEGRFPVSYYYIASEYGDLESVTQELSNLIGRQPLPPLWSLGYITSKYGYHTQDEALGVLDTLKREGYPVDGIVLDLYWYGKEQDMGRLAWDKDQWPDHKQMLKTMKDMGVHLIPISQPYLLRNGRGVDNYNELRDKGMLVRDTLGNPLEVKIWVGEGGMFDVSKPSTRSWLANRYKTLTDEGISGWWGDLGEPEVHPDSALHYNGLTAREYHNLYGNDWSKIIYDMYQQEYPEERVITLMRAGTTGLGKYGVIPWSTDVSRSWGGLQPQVTIMLNSGLSGMGYMSSDIGGFAIDDNHPYDPELYVRWLQLGTFSPVLRTHAQRTAEPYHYPEQQGIILNLIKERYRWLPYNYALAYENALLGRPLVRPVNYYSGEQDNDNIEDEYLWGADLLVAPVMEPGVKSRKVIFPMGKWLDMQNPSLVYEQGDTIGYPTPLEVLPRFVRAGAIIPLTNYDLENTGDYRADDYLINFYPVPGEVGQTKIYEDDFRSSKNIERNDYSVITLTGSDEEEYGIGISATSEGTYIGATQVKKLTFRIHNIDKPKTVMIDERKADSRAMKYDKKHRTLDLTVTWNVEKPLEIFIPE